MDQEQPDSQPTLVAYQVHPQLMWDTLQYLSTKPFAEVRQLIEALESNSQPIFAGSPETPVPTLDETALDPEATDVEQPETPVGDEPDGSA